MTSSLEGKKKGRGDNHLFFHLSCICDEVRDRRGETVGADVEDGNSGSDCRLSCRDRDRGWMDRYRRDLEAVVVRGFGGDLDLLRALRRYGPSEAKRGKARESES